MGLRSLRLPSMGRRVRERLRPDPIRVALDVVEQLIVGELLRLKTAMAQDLRDRVLADRPTANAQQVRLSLIRLESLRLLEGKEGAEPDAGLRVTSGGGRRYRLMRDGARLRAVIPREPRSSIPTHL